MFLEIKALGKSIVFWLFWMVGPRVKPWGVHHRRPDPEQALHRRLESV